MSFLGSPSKHTSLQTEAAMGQMGNFLLGVVRSRSLRRHPTSQEPAAKKPKTWTDI